MGRVPLVYRVTKSNPPDRHDFLSSALQEKDLRPPEIKDPRLYAGVSTFLQRSQAEDRARVFPALGTFVVQMQVPDAGNAPVALFASGATSGHITVVGTPARLLSYCVLGACLPITR